MPRSSTARGRPRLGRLQFSDLAVDIFQVAQQTRAQGQDDRVLGRAVEPVEMNSAAVMIGDRTESVESMIVRQLHRQALQHVVDRLIGAGRHRRRVRHQSVPFVTLRSFSWA